MPNGVADGCFYLMIEAIEALARKGTVEAVGRGERATCTWPPAPCKSFRQEVNKKELLRGNRTEGLTTVSLSMAFWYTVVEGKKKGLLLQ